MNDLVADALRTVLDNLPSEESQRAYRNDWGRYTAWLATQGIAVIDVKPKHIGAHLAHLREQKLKRTTIGRALSVIREVYGALVRDEALPANPAREVKNPRAVHEVKRPYLSMEQVQKLFAPEPTTWEEHRDRLCLQLLLGLGWRRAEVAGIKVSDIDFAAKTITGVLKRGKSLTAGMPEWLAESLTQWVDAGNIGATGVLLPRGREDPRPLSGDMIYKLVKTATARVGFAIGPHVFRRTFITLSGKLGASLKERQLAVGHDSMSTTEGYDRERSAAENAPGRVFADLMASLIVDPNNENQ